MLLKETLFPVHYDILDGQEFYHLELVSLELLLTLKNPVALSQSKDFSYIV